jgi:hypothetical protein
MSLILGILDSGGAAASAGSYESIATVTANSGTTAVLDSIPSTYKHLQVRFVACRDGSSGFLNVRFNGDTGSNYSDHYLYGTGSAVTSSGDANQTRILYVSPVQDSANNYKAVGIMDIFDYASTTKYKTSKHFSGVDKNAVGGNVWLSSGLWRSTSAITSITFDLSGDTFGTSTFALYGIKG